MIWPIRLITHQGQHTQRSDDDKRWRNEDCGWQKKKSCAANKKREWLVMWDYRTAATTVVPAESRINEWLLLLDKHRAHSRLCLTEATDRHFFHLLILMTGLSLCSGGSGDDGVIGDNGTAVPAGKSNCCFGCRTLVVLVLVGRLFTWLLEL